MLTVLNKLKITLQKDKRLISDGGELLKNKIIELALKFDKELIHLLMKEEDLKKHFFTDVDKIIVFDQLKFMKFVDNKEFLPDSYTTFKNKVGLTVEGNYLSQNKEVVLSWPYKDCILEGGMEKEDEKRDEVFFNEILAPDEIDRLKEPKVFTSFKRIDANGEHEVIEIKPKDNLIIRENNLFALYSLKKNFSGMIKLIYIDPPYNTGNDEFKYNDSFNHSTWLTFMKNRLEVARDLLSDDGTIFVSINHIELGYLTVLMDEIFGRENKLPIITLKVGTTASYRSINDCPVNVTEYILAYSKLGNYKPNTVYRETGYTEDYSHYIENFDKKPELWSLVKITDIVHKTNGCGNWKEYKEKKGANWKRKRFEEMEDFAFKNKDRVVSLNTLQKPSQKIQEVINNSKENRNKIFYILRENAEPIYCFNGRTLAFFNSKFKEIEEENVPAEVLTNLWTDISFLGIGPEGGVTLENGKKPEYLIKTILELTTKKGDLVLDYHLGCGTTCAVAHKMGRQYIGVEQLDYGENDSVVRLKNVIGKENVKGKIHPVIENYDTTGISEVVNWKGGGDFVYCKLVKLNEKYVDELKKTKTSKEILKIWNLIKEKAVLSYKVSTEDFDKNVKEFEQLSLENQKKFLMECLDKNQLYVNLSEIDDEDYAISKEDKKINKKFYGAI